MDKTKEDKNVAKTIPPVPKEDKKSPSDVDSSIPTTPTPPTTLSTTSKVSPTLNSNIPSNGSNVDETPVNSTKKESSAENDKPSDVVRLLFHSFFVTFSVYS